MKMLVGMMIKNFDMRMDEKNEIRMELGGLLSVHDPRVEIKLR